MISHTFTEKITWCGSHDLKGYSQSPRSEITRCGEVRFCGTYFDTVLNKDNILLDLMLLTEPVFLFTF